MEQFGVLLYLVILFGLSALLLFGLQTLEALLRKAWPNAVDWLLSGWHLVHVCAVVAFIAGSWISLSGELSLLPSILQLVFPFVLIAIVYVAPVVAAACAMLFVNPFALVELVSLSLKRLYQYVFRLKH